MNQAGGDDAMPRRKRRSVCGTPDERELDPTPARRERIPADRPRVCDSDARRARAVMPPSRGPGRSSSHGERGPGRDVIDGAADEDCLGGPGRKGATRSVAAASSLSRSPSTSRSKPPSRLNAPATASRSHDLLPLWLSPSVSRAQREDRNRLVERSRRPDSNRGPLHYE